MEKTLKVVYKKQFPIPSLRNYIKHKIWLSIQKKMELRERWENGEFEKDGMYWRKVNIHNGVIGGLQGLLNDLNRAYEGNEVKWEMPEKVYPNPKSLEINELEGLDSEPIDNQSVTY